MNCSRIKELFSESIDGRLDKEQEALVKDHLMLCGDCRDEFESMKAVIREMGSLDTIKAPDDFLASLHGRIKSESWFQKIKAFLFIPTRMRLPVELATLATAVVITFFIFHIVPPGISPKISLKTPLKSEVGLKDEKSAGGIQSNENAPAGAVIKPSETKAVSDKSLSAPQKKQNHYDREPASKPSPGVPATEALGSAEKDQIRGYGKTMALPAPSKTIEPLRITLLLKPEGGKIKLSSESGENVRKLEAKAESLHAPVRLQAGAKADMAEVKSKDEALPALTLSEEKEKPLVYQERLFPDIEKQIKNTGGSILKTDINNETGQPEYLLIEISGQEYQKLIEKLGEFGKIQMPPAGDVGQSNQPVQVRLHILINK